MPNATKVQYNNLQKVVDSLCTLEAAARKQGDRALEFAARRARRELTIASSATTPEITPDVS